MLNSTFTYLRGKSDFLRVRKRFEFLELPGIYLLLIKDLNRNVKNLKNLAILNQNFCVNVTAWLKIRNRFMTTFKMLIFRSKSPLDFFIRNFLSVQLIQTMFDLINTIDSVSALSYCATSSMSKELLKEII